MLHRNYAKDGGFATAQSKNADLSTMTIKDCTKTYRAMLHLGVVYKKK